MSKYFPCTLSRSNDLHLFWEGQISSLKNLTNYEQNTGIPILMTKPIGMLFALIDGQMKK